MTLTSSYVHLDAADPLSEFRGKFNLTDPGLIYFDGNSLGALPVATIAAIGNTVKTEWGDRLIRSYNDKWWDMPSRVGRRIAALVGAHEDEIIVCDTTSVNMFKLAIGALRLMEGRKKIVSDEMNFPSDIYILQGAADLLAKGHHVELMKSDQMITIPDTEIKRVVDSNTALVSISHVSFRSAFMYDMEATTKLIHEEGALVMWDLCHAVGAVPIDLNGSGADMAVGCTYKYLNGGPGCPAFLYVKRELQDKLIPGIWGWWGEKKPFDFTLDYRPGEGIKRHLAGSPPIISMSTLDPSLDIILEAGMDRLREKSLKMSNYMISLVEEKLFPLGFTRGYPLNEKMRGSHISIRHPEAFRICKALTDPSCGDYTIIPDFREPDNIRLGLAPSL